MVLDAPHEPLAEDENMVPNKDQLEQMAKSLEGLEMLCQWQLTLARDLRAKAETLLRLPNDKPANNPSQ